MRLPLADCRGAVVEQISQQLLQPLRSPESEAAVGFRVPDVDLVTEDSETRIGESTRSKAPLLFDPTENASFDRMDLGWCPCAW